MALSTPSLLDTATQGSGSSLTSGTVSPSANALVLVFFSSSGGVQRTLSSVSSTFSIDGSWVTEQEVDMDAIGSDQGTFVLAYAQTGASPGSGTVTVELSGNQGRSALHVIELTGHNTTTPISQSANGSATSGSVSATLSSSPASSSTVIGVGTGADADGIAPDAAFTEIADVGAYSTYTLRLASAYDEASPVDTVTWDNFSLAGNRYAIIAEVAEASSGTTVDVAITDAGEQVSADVETVADVSAVVTDGGEQISAEAATVADVSAGVVDSGEVIAADVSTTDIRTVDAAVVDGSEQVAAELDTRADVTGTVTDGGEQVSGDLATRADITSAVVDGGEIIEIQARQGEPIYPELLSAVLIDLQPAAWPVEYTPGASVQDLNPTTRFEE